MSVAAIPEHMASISAALTTMGRLLPAGPLRVIIDWLTGASPDVGTVDDFGMDPNFVAEIKPVLDTIYTRFFRVEVEGIEHVPKNGPAILVANHAGSLPWDAVILAHAVRTEHAQRRVVRPLVEDHFFYFPYLGTLLNRLGAVRACSENARRLLASNNVVASFPEGVKGAAKPWRERYRLQRFGRGGTIRLALNAGAPLVPVAILGAEETHPLLFRLRPPMRRSGLPFVPITPTFPWLGPLGLMPLPVRWRIRFGPAITLERYRDQDAPLDRLLINRLNEELRQTVQGMVRVLLRERGGIFS